MNKEQILEKALEHGFMLSTAHGQQSKKMMPVSDAATILSFAKYLIAATKEEDAKICEEFGKPNSMQSIAESIHTEAASKQIAAAIRESKP